MLSIDKAPNTVCNHAKSLSLFFNWLKTDDVYQNDNIRKIEKCLK